MAINISQVESDATVAVQLELAKLYKDSDANGMRDFAEAIAKAAVVAVTHVIQNAETEISGEGLR